MKKVPIRWYGAKLGFLDEIYKKFPVNYHAYNYVEPFGGGGSVLICKYPSVKEVYNDLNHELTNFFETVRVNPLGVIKLSRFAPDSQILIDKYLKEDPSTLSNEERAFRFWYINVYSFSGINNGWHGLMKFKKYQQFLPGKLENPELTDFTPNEGRDLYKMEGRLFRTALRFKNVQITNYDYEYIIKKTDAANTFFYIDPPYIEGGFKYAEMHGLSKENEFTIEDHRKLANLLKNIKGKFLLSIDGNNKLADEIYGFEGVIKTTFNVRYIASRFENKEAVEGLFRNYNETMESALGFYESPVNP